MVPRSVRPEPPVFAMRARVPIAVLILRTEPRPAVPGTGPRSSTARNALGVCNCCTDPDKRLYVPVIAFTVTVPTSPPVKEIALCALARPSAHGVLARIRNEIALCAPARRTNLRKVPSCAMFNGGYMSQPLIEALQRIVKQWGELPQSNPNRTIAEAAKRAISDLGFST